MKLILAAVIAATLILPARAEEAAPAPKAKSSWGDFLKNLKSALSQSAVGGERKKGRGAQGVAAVRGDDQTKKNIADPNEPGLKGDAKAVRAKRDMAYDLELEAAVDQLSKGKLEEGLKALEAFKAVHPKHRAKDVDGAIEGAKAAIAEKGGTSKE